ncbi:hypothetical protein [Arcobacter sp. YIC-80]|uniref:hypothetical protein n=1 Tax=unclassified Arcobacter TaxID=2593671 RepID=UPI00384DCAA9
MTLEEQEEFKQKIAETILPVAVNMTEEQIRIVILNVLKDNEEINPAFGDMLFEQIMVYKYNLNNKNSNN